MTDRTLDEAMGMPPDEIAQMRARVDRLALPYLLRSSNDSSDLRAVHAASCHSVQKKIAATNPVPVLGAIESCSAASELSAAISNTALMKNAASDSTNETAAHPFSGMRALSIACDAATTCATSNTGAAAPTTTQYSEWYAMGSECAR